VGTGSAWQPQTSGGYKELLWADLLLVMVLRLE
jgi:hypothetical protein